MLYPQLIGTIGLVRIAKAPANCVGPVDGDSNADWPRLSGAFFNYRVMPLRRAPYHEPILNESIFYIRLPMLDDHDRLIWIEVSDYAVRQRAMLDGAETNLGKAALFDRYRDLIEKRASELYDRGAAVIWSKGVRFLQVATGVL